MHPNAMYFEDFTVGSVFETPARTVTESDITAFACLTGDQNPLHVDAEFAANGPFGARVAHGMLGLSMAVGLQSRLGLVDGTAVALLDLAWKFIKPIHIGDTIHLRGEVARVRQSRSLSDSGIITMQISLRNQREELVAQGTWTFIIRCRETKAAKPDTATEGTAVDKPAGQPLNEGIAVAAAS